MKEIDCPNCNSIIEIVDGYHSGFADEGFLYCNRDSTVMTWSAYNPKYIEIVGSIMPDILTRDGQKQIEENLIGCPCGGKFLFANPLLCPKCGGVLSEPMTKNIYCIIIKNRINGQKEKIWID